MNQRSPSTSTAEFFNKICQKRPSGCMNLDFVRDHWLDLAKFPYGDVERELFFDWLPAMQMCAPEIKKKSMYGKSVQSVQGVARTSA
jgi:hypothetical protein